MSDSQRPEREAIEQALLDALVRESKLMDYADLTVNDIQTIRANVDWISGVLAALPPTPTPREAPADAPPATPFSKTWRDKEQRLVPDKPPAPPALTDQELAMMRNDAEPGHRGLSTHQGRQLLAGFARLQEERDTYKRKYLECDSLVCPYERRMQAAEAEAQALRAQLKAAQEAPK
jgi:hypothetical protein